MPLDPMKPWPFNTPGLPGLVLNDLDYQNRGYVWGSGGGVWYCFLDPKRFRFEIWEKKFDPIHLLWLIPNLIGAGIAFYFGGIWGALKVFAAIPTGPLVFLGHYRSSAKSQEAAVVTNGPQMEYPGRIGTWAMAGTVTVLSAAAGIAAGLNVMRTFSVTVAGKVVVSSTFIKALAGVATGVGIGINGAALLIFLAGLLSTPYFQLKSNGRQLGNHMNYGGWYHFGRNAQSISTYRVAPDAPSSIPAVPTDIGLNWGSGGLIPIVYNRASRNAPGLQAVVWALLPLAADGSWAQPPAPVDEGTTSDESGSDTAATTSGLDPSTWVEGMILVAGSENWHGGHNATLIAHGVVHAMASDAHFSPLLGSSGMLVMETAPFMDPIGNYGFMCLPQ